MIYANIEDIKRYKGLHVNIDKAIDFITNISLSELPLGSTAIDGESIFLTVSDYETVSRDNLSFESHIKYIDIHIMQQGEEYVDVAHVGSLKECEREEGIDYVGYEGVAQVNFKVTQNDFLLLFPEDAHKVKIMTKNKEYVRKIVFKVAL